MSYLRLLSIDEPAITADRPAAKPMPQTLELDVMFVMAARAQVPLRMLLLSSSKEKGMLLPQKPAGMRMVDVRAHEKLRSFVQRCGSDVHMVAKANWIAVNGFVYPGQRLWV